MIRSTITRFPKSLRDIGVCFVNLVSCVLLLCILPVGHGQTSGTVQQADHLNELISKLKDSDPRVRLDAVRDLRDIEDARTVEPLIGSLKDADWKVRENAAVALGRSNDPRAMYPLLVFSEGDPNPSVTTALSEITLPDGTTGLMMASLHGRLELVRRLLAAKADVNAKTIRGETALMYASQGWGDDEIVQALISAKADVNISMADGGGTTLLDERAEWHAKLGSRGYTALMGAARFGSLGVVQSLIHARADVNAQTAGGTESGTTALMYASEACRVEVVLELLKAGADANPIRADGETAFSLASRGACDNLARELGSLPSVRERGGEEKGELAGYIRDDAGNPVKGLEVLLVGRYARLDHTSVAAIIWEGNLYTSDHRFSTHHATTDETGRYSMNGLVPGSYTFITVAQERKVEKSSRQRYAPPSHEVVAIVGGAKTQHDVALHALGQASRQ